MTKEQFAKAILDALKASNKHDYAQAVDGDLSHIIIDGRFDLLQVAEMCLRKPDEPSSPHERMNWRSLRSASKDGSHILATIVDESAGFGWFNGQKVHTQTVVHWWGHPGEEGFYTSVSEQEPQHPFKATHWMPLPDAPDCRPCGCVGGEFCGECY